MIAQKTSPVTKQGYLLHMREKESHLHSLDREVLAEYSLQF